MRSSSSGSGESSSPSAARLGLVAACRLRRLGSRPRRRRDLGARGRRAAASLVAGFVAAHAGHDRSCSSSGSSPRERPGEPPRARTAATPTASFAAFLCCSALGMIGGCELVYFKDTYGQDLQRMNTIFKFYHQAWPLLAIGGAVFAGRAWDAADRRRPRPSASLARRGRRFLALLWPVNVDRLPRCARRTRPFSLDARGPARPPRRRATPPRSTGCSATRRTARSVLEASGDPYSRVRPHLFAHRDADGPGLGQPRGPLARQRPRDRGAQGRASGPSTRRRIRASPGTRSRSTAITHVVLGDMERRTYPTPTAVARFPFLTPVLHGRDHDLRGRSPRDEGPDGDRLLPAQRVGADALRRAPLGGPRPAAATTVPVLTHRHQPELAARERENGVRVVRAPVAARRRQGPPRALDPRARARASFRARTSSTCTHRPPTRFR